jgi:hypothetical protein
VSWPEAIAVRICVTSVADRKLQPQRGFWLRFGQEGKRQAVASALFDRFSWNPASGLVAPEMPGPFRSAVKHPVVIGESKSTLKRRTATQLGYCRFLHLSNAQKGVVTGLAVTARTGYFDGLLDIPQKPVIVPDESLPAIVPLSRQFVVQVLQKWQKRILQLAILFLHVQRTFLPLELFPIVVEAKAVEEVFTSYQRHIP